MIKYFYPNVVATRLSRIVVSENPKFSKSEDKIRYGIEWMFSGLNQITLVSIIAWPFGVHIESLVILIAGALFRMFSGGAHFKGYFLCLFFSTLQIIGIAFIGKEITPFLSYAPIFWSVVLCITFIITTKKAPVLHKKKHLFSKGKIRLMKIVSLVTLISIIITSLLLPSSIKYSVWLALGFQAFTLTSLWGKCVLFLGDIPHILSKRS